MAEQSYELMHKDDVVASLQLDDLSGAILKVTPGTNPELLPLGGSQGADSLRKWWLRRAVPISQGNIAALLQQEGIPSTQSLLVRNLGLSLSDHYWIKPNGSELTWKDVSLFSNSFRDPLESMQIQHPHGAASTSTQTPAYSPSASLQGDLIKKWLIVDDTRCLLKGNRGANSQQSLNEVLASMLHEKQGFSNHVRYRPVKFTGSASEQYGCICEDFASETLEFIPAIDVVDSEKKDNAVSTYEHFIHVCTAHGLSELEVRSFLEYQILTDFVLTNTDRHLNNFGVLRNSRTLKFVRMAPIFDSGNSMFWDAPRLPERSNCTEITVNSFRKTETELLKLVTDRSCVRMDLLPCRDEIAELYAKDDSIAFVDSKLVFRHLIPNILPQFLVYVSTGVASSIIMVSSFAFLGLGLPSGTPEWGAMLNDARTALYSHPELLIYPGLCIFVTAAGFNLFGEALRDILTPEEDSL